MTEEHHFECPACQQALSVSSHTLNASLTLWTVYCGNPKCCVTANDGAVGASAAQAFGNLEERLQADSILKT
jgi:transcription elongation factor Elf1